MSTDTTVEPTLWKVASAYGPKRYALCNRTTLQDGKPNLYTFIVNAQFQVKCTAETCDEYVVDKWVSSEPKPVTLKAGENFVKARWSKEELGTKTCTCGQKNTFNLVCNTVVTHYLDTGKLVWKWD